MQTAQTPQLSAWQLFRIWSGIGLQSFGGGASTSYLIQREFSVKRTCITMEEYLHLWNLCMFAPGINLIALTILIGKKLGGFWGMLLSLLGMLLPSSIITCLIAALFTQVRDLHATQSILKGIIPATGGIMLLVGLRFSLPQYKRARLEGGLSLFFSLLLVLVCAVALIVVQLPVFIVLPSAGLAGIVLFTNRHNILPIEGGKQ
ncbi:chromate transporter [Tengunoibacter tsumagoiensis]|uniref:Chromate transporter n=1 Tax=Tengunoibacter tsumagoiensis TaxID=2014871 RepID=A0A401ZU34_9CHLR|nr:chromate transporter [Tengunoibacter tsumagoiensis]GCE10306.1 hypothetical protein KTT_01650 [Tengunoibacter tsumagoiensis]